MKRSIVILMLVVLIFSFTSCFDINEDKEVTYYSTMVTLTDAENYSFRTDDGYTLNSINSVSTDSTFKTGKRYFVRFTYADTTGHASMTYPIKVDRLWDATVRQFVNLESDSVDVYENQPIYRMYFLALGGNYLNVVFNTFASAGETDTYELVRVKKDEANTSNDSFPTVALEIRHNVPLIYISYSNTRIVSFDLNPLRTAFPGADSIKLQVKWMEYPNVGQSSYTFKYKPGLKPLNNLSSGLSPLGYRPACQRVGSSGF